MSTAPSEVLMPSETKKKVKKPAAGKASAVLKDELEVMAHELETMDKDTAFAAVAPLMEVVDSNYIRLGGVLAVIQANEWWESEGYETFRDLIEKKFGLLRYRKAMYLIQIYDDLIKSGVAWEDVKSLGWCKLKEVSPIITKSNCAEWVAKAEKLTVLQLREVVQKAVAKLEAGQAAPVADEEATSTTTTITFKVHSDQKQTIKLAIEKAKGETKTEFDAVALEGICINYLGGGKVTKKPKSIKELVRDLDPMKVLEALVDLHPELEIAVTTTE